LVAGCSSKSGPGAPGALQLKTVVTITGGGAHMPVLVTAPPGDIARLLVVDKYGLIRVVRADTLVPTPFLDIHTLITSNGTEQGLLGLAFSPNYATDKSFYVTYNNLSWNVTLARYKVGANPDVADPTSAQILMTIDHHNYSNHNGGMLAFGPDHMLYMSIGDGGLGGDPYGAGQNVKDSLACIFRLDVSGGGGYSVPADNPFVTAPPGANPTVWCYGLRNPWRFSFDRSTGDLYIGDVGQGDYEEVDVATAASGGGKGVDFGWSVLEGDSCYPPGTHCTAVGALPVIAYAHDANQNCVIGGYVYRGSVIPGLQGTYFYSDYGAHWLHSFVYMGGVATAQKDWGVDAGDLVTSFGEDARGELYVCCQGGAVKRLTP
ncbi:MAG: PQQ-dependent sugar dehydrogenase, partial [Candidatus Eisenbacteria bacterium]